MQAHNNATVGTLSQRPVWQGCGGPPLCHDPSHAVRGEASFRSFPHGAIMLTHGKFEPYS